MTGSCPRCGARGLLDTRFCWACSDGVADADRARELVVAALAGSRDATRILADLEDPRAYDVVLVSATVSDPGVRRAALSAVARIGDPRAIDIVAAQLDGADDDVRHAAIACLAELGPDAAEALAGRLPVVEDRAEAAMALAWLRDDRAFEALAELVGSPELLREAPFYGHAYRNPVVALGWLDGPEALAVLATAADRVAAAYDAGEPVRWQVTSVASTLAYALSRMREPGAAAVLERMRERVGLLYAYGDAPVAPFRPPSDARRTVPRWSFELERADAPLAETVTKFGGQPVWMTGPAWPLGVDGEPATFFAQFAVPEARRVAYLFLDPSADPVEPDEREGILFVQPGAAVGAFTALVAGPTFRTDRQEPGRYVPRMLCPLIESRAILEAGFDPPDWEAFDADRGDEWRDDDRDWNKIGGTPRWLQAPEEPEEPGWRFLFQFSAARVGHELGDGAEVYGFIHEDGRGVFIVQSH